MTLLSLQLFPVLIFLSGHRLLLSLCPPWPVVPLYRQVGKSHPYNQWLSTPVWPSTFTLYFFLFLWAFLTPLRLSSMTCCSTLCIDEQTSRILTINGYLPPFDPTLSLYIPFLLIFLFGHRLIALQGLFFIFNTQEDKPFPYNQWLSIRYDPKLSFYFSFLWASLSPLSSHFPHDLLFQFTDKQSTHILTISGYLASMTLHFHFTFPAFWFFALGIPLPSFLSSRSLFFSL